MVCVSSCYCYVFSLQAEQNSEVQLLAVFVTHKYNLHNWTSKCGPNQFV